jgi:hypothetical protein
MKNLILSVGVTLSVSFFALFAFSKEVKSEYILCRLGAEVRTLRVTKLEDGQCRTLYSKGGKDQNVGQAKSSAVCVSVLESIRKNLESQNWKCKDISQSEVSESASDQISF